ncbi:hypothetical protein J437_LFUL015609 [Ladona fulva]|uniref:Uncharacterized protein n=1 Tax=Ladona fulva TaxID=123851 RepID=A0A8K0KIA5_LADFU|nr:hypothetical protein J437_LFUL015609 [Ladona fulva]
MGGDYFFKFRWSLTGGGEAVSTLGEDLHQVVNYFFSRVQTFIDGYSVGNTISRVEHNTGGTTGGVQGKHSLDGDIHGWGVEGLKHDLGHLLTVSLGVEGSLREQNRVLLGGDSQLVVEGVMPDLLHVVPVGDDSMFNGVLQGEDTSLGLCLITYIAVLLTHTHHHTLLEVKNIDVVRGRKSDDGKVDDTS